MYFALFHRIIMPIISFFSFKGNNFVLKQTSIYFSCMFSSPVKEICVLCRLSPSELVEEWIAHVTSVGCNQEPTLSTLGEFERKVSVMLYTPNPCFYM